MKTNTGAAVSIKLSCRTFKNILADLEPIFELNARRMQAQPILNVGKRIKKYFNVDGL